MSNFTVIEDLPLFPNLFEEFVQICKEVGIDIYKHNQICINTIKNKPRDFLLGSQSLTDDWDRKIESEINGVKSLYIPKKKNPLRPEDFDTLCSQFVGTSFEELFNVVKERFTVGRIRVMTSYPKTCLSWHADATRRLHLPIKTQEGCFMVISDEVKYLTINNWWLTDTTKPHTAFNSSKESRTHLVVEVL